MILQVKYSITDWLYSAKINALNIRLQNIPKFAVWYVPAQSMSSTQPREHSLADPCRFQMNIRGTPHMYVFIIHNKLISKVSRGPGVISVTIWENSANLYIDVKLISAVPLPLPCTLFLKGCLRI